MPTEQDSQLGKIAVKNKLLSEEQVSKCLAEVTKTEKEWHARVTYTWDKKLIFWNYVKPVVIDEKFGSY